MSTAAIVLVNVGVGCLVASGALMYQEIGEVNRKLPDNQQISYLLFYSEKVSRIKREHKRLYPQSSIDRFRVVFQIVGLALMLLAALASGVFKFWPFK